MYVTLHVCSSHENDSKLYTYVGTLGWGTSRSGSGSDCRDCRWSVERVHQKWGTGESPLVTNLKKAIFIQKDKILKYIYLSMSYINTTPEVTMGVRLTK